MQFSITNFRGVAHAEITAERITLIAGKNHAGKTSIIQAMQAALTGNTIPIDGLKKSSAGRLVRSGTASGEVEIYDDNGHASVMYPEASRSSDGNAPEIDEYSAGIKSLCDLPKAQRSEAIADLIQARPTVEELAQELKKLGVPKASSDRICETVTAQGWDSAHSAAKEKGARLKGAWENETGERFGSRKADEWFPLEWDADLETATEESLTAAVEHERRWLEAAISYEAVAMAENDALYKQVQAGKGAEKKSLDLTEELNGLFANETAIRKGLTALPRAEQPKAQPCPHCNQMVAIDNGKLLVAAMLSDEEIAKRKSDIADSEKSLADIKTQIAKKSAALGEAKSVVAVGKKAAQTIAEQPPKSQSSAETKGSTDDCRQHFSRAEARLLAWSKRKDAAALSDAIASNAEIVSVLAADGLRMAKLQRSMKNLNDTLSRLSASAKWGRVSVGKDMDISYNGTPYMLCSESEQFRARVTIQVCIALARDSRIVLIDRADVLDSTGRNGLIGMLLSTDRRAVIAMTIDSHDRVPNVAKVGGCGYWIEDGVATAL